MTADPADDIDIAASYSRRDAAAVIPILDALKARGVRVWFDKNIPGGALWEETITRFMRKAKAVVFFASRASLESDRCFDEVSAARTLKRPIIPVLVEHVNIPDDLPDRLVLTLQTRNTVEAYPGADGDPVEAIMRALAAFGVRGSAGAEAPRPAATVVPADPEPVVTVAPPPPRPAPPPPPAPRAKSRLPLIAAMAGGLAAVIVGGLFVTGVFKPGAAAGAEIAENEWCGLPAPTLVKRSGFKTPAELEEAAKDGDIGTQTLHCISANAACTTGADADGYMSRAFASCQAAGDRGNWRAVFNQGWLKQRGCGVPVDSAGAATAYTRSAEAGCAIAQFYLGTLYQDGELVGYDDAQAIRWLTAASDQNYPPALNRLGAAYARGQGVPEDDTKAAELFRRAADLGDPRAMLNYARVLETGVGVPKNTGAAIAYYRRAASQSDDAEIKQLAEDSLKRLGASTT